MTAIDVEFGIRREYQWIGHGLGHAHQARSARLIGTLTYFRKNATTASTFSSKLNLASTFSA